MQYNTIGSNYYFSVIKGFESSHNDDLVYNNDMIDVKIKQELLDRLNVYNYNFKDCKDYLDYVKESKADFKMCFILHNHFRNAYGVTIDDLKSIIDAFDTLSDKYQYHKIIANYFIQNGDFFLTKEQLFEAYKSYCSTRDKEIPEDITIIDFNDNDHITIHCDNKISIEEASNDEEELPPHWEPNHIFTKEEIR